MITLEQYMDTDELITVSDVTSVAGREYDDMCIAYQYYFIELQALRTQLISYQTKNPDDQEIADTLRSTTTAMHTSMEAMAVKLAATMVDVEANMTFTLKDHIGRMNEMAIAIRDTHINPSKLGAYKTDLLSKPKLDELLLNCVSLNTMIVKAAQIIKQCNLRNKDVIETIVLQTGNEHLEELFKIVPARFAFQPTTYDVYNKKAQTLISELKFTNSTICEGHGYSVSHVTTTKITDTINNVGRDLQQQTHDLFRVFIYLYKVHDYLYDRKQYNTAELLLRFMKNVTICTMYCCLLEYAILIALKSYGTAQRAIYDCRN